MLTMQLILQGIQFGLIVTSALMMWKGLWCVCFNESPMVVVLSGSMEPSMYRGDILVLFKYDEINVGDVVVYNVDGQNIPIVHRISSLQEVKDEKTGELETYFLSKGDNNPVDDRGIYPKGTAYLKKSNVVGHVLG